jgi:hypothetical protein
MKHSDSKNSLSELNPDDLPCFICLEIENEIAEPLVSSTLLRTCGCKFKVHPYCWNQWMKDKSSYDCPICRKKSLFSTRAPTPLNEFLATNHPPPEAISMHFVYFYIGAFSLSIAGITVFVLFNK